MKNETLKRPHVSFTLTIESTKDLYEFSLLRGVDPEAIVDLMAVIGFEKELRRQLETARDKAGISQERTYRPIDWRAVDRPKPKRTYRPMRWPSREERA